MDLALLIAAIVASCSLLAWTWLILARGHFGKSDQRLDPAPQPVEPGFQWPSVAAVVPARNEAQIIPHCLPTLLRQDYPGDFQVFLVDDGSEDDTGEVARRIAEESGQGDRLTVVVGEPLPRGWAGKVWALHQGAMAASRLGPDFLLLTDADISYAPDILGSLVLKAMANRLDLVSLMAMLRASSFWEKALIPAFVFFFAMIYPFRWVNHPENRTAAAAGGCILLRREALERAGGFLAMPGALIDDCTLAGLVKTRGGGRLWLGLTHQVRSQRSYHGLGGVWSMVARSAFTQLRHSWLALAGTVLGMMVVYVAPPLALAGGLAALGAGADPTLGLWLAATGGLAWGLMSLAYVPMLRWYDQSPAWILLMPLTALLYTLMTVDSAFRRLRGRGGEWKGRTCLPPSTG